MLFQHNIKDLNESPKLDYFKEVANKILKENIINKLQSIKLNSLNSD